MFPVAVGEHHSSPSPSEFVTDSNLAMTTSPGPKRLHWLASSLAAGSFLTAVLLAIGHDQFYQYRNGSITSTAEYNLLGNRFSTQQFNLAVGNAFALLVRSAFALSTSIAFCQVFWRLARQESNSRQPPTLKRLDAAYSATSNLFNLFYIPIWCRYPLLFSTAVVSWYVRLFNTMYLYRLMSCEG